VAPDTMQQNETESAQETGPKPPEYWTEANTAAWALEVYGAPDEHGEVQRTWGSKITYSVGKAGPSCYRPPSPEEMAKWRLNDPRPSNAFYYDGTPIANYQPLRVKKPRAKRVAA
jgi:hypothetical protein